MSLNGGTISQGEEVWVVGVGRKGRLSARWHRGIHGPCLAVGLERISLLRAFLRARPVPRGREEHPALRLAARLRLCKEFCSSLILARHSGRQRLSVCVLAMGEIAASLAIEQTTARARFDGRFADFAGPASQRRMAALARTAAA